MDSCEEADAAGAIVGLTSRLNYINHSEVTWRGCRFVLGVEFSKGKNSLHYKAAQLAGVSLPSSKHRVRLVWRSARPGRALTRRMPAESVQRVWS